MAAVSPQQRQLVAHLDKAIGEVRIATARIQREVTEYSGLIDLWDVINEPEWAMTGAGKYGSDEDFEPTAGLQAVTHDQMETFVADVITGLRAESSALVMGLGNIAGPGLALAEYFANRGREHARD